MDPVVVRLVTVVLAVVCGVINQFLTKDPDQGIRDYWLTVIGMILGAWFVLDVVDA